MTHDDISAVVETTFRSVYSKFHLHVFSQLTGDDKSMEFFVGDIFHNILSLPSLTHKKYLAEEEKSSTGKSR